MMQGRREKFSGNVHSPVSHELSDKENFRTPALINELI